MSLLLFFLSNLIFLLLNESELIDTSDLRTSYSLLESVQYDSLMRLDFLIQSLADLTLLFMEKIAICIEIINVSILISV